MNNFFIHAIYKVIIMEVLDCNGLVIKVGDVVFYKETNNEIYSGTIVKIVESLPNFILTIEKYVGKQLMSVFRYNDVVSLNKTELKNNGYKPVDLYGNLLTVGSPVVFTYMCDDCFHRGKIIDIIDNDTVTVEFDKNNGSNSFSVHNLSAKKVISELFIKIPNKK